MQEQNLRRRLQSISLKNRTNRHRTTKVRVSGLELPIVNPLIRFVFMDTQFMVIHCVLEKIVMGRALQQPLILQALGLYL